MTAAVLKRHDENRADQRRAWLPAVPVEGHPPIPTEALPMWGRRVLGHRWTADGSTIRWYSGDGAASWAAVTDLHRAGRHDTACALAVLLRWCDEQAAAGTVVWVVDATTDTETGTDPEHPLEGR